MRVVGSVPRRRTDLMTLLDEAEDIGNNVSARTQNI